MAAVVGLLAGCPSEDAPADSAQATETGTGTGIETAADTSSGGDSTTTGTSTSTTDGSATDGSATDGGGPLFDCEIGSTQCNDGADNDSDGEVDADDPECTGPCDDDESSFQTGISGDNVDCKQDCFFDGNSGQGNDGCIWDLRCDPENPGASQGCEYEPGRCSEDMMGFNEECVAICGALTPNGCDCFGCCTVQTPDGDVNIFLNSGPDCSLANLDACASCTPTEECGNGCNPDGCEVCFGETEPPEGCDQPECPTDQTSCTGAEDCAEGFFCLTGCCVPFDPQG